MPVPLYGFLQGDTIGLLVVADDTETMQDLANRLQEFASVRVARRQGCLRVIFRGQTLAPQLTVAEAGMTPLQRFDVVPE